MHQPVSIEKPTPKPGEVDVWELYDGPGEVMVFSCRALLYLLYSPSTSDVVVAEVNVASKSARVKLTGPARDGEFLSAQYRLSRGAVHDVEFGLNEQEKVMLYRGISRAYNLTSLFQRGEYERFRVALNLPKVV